MSSAKPLRFPMLHPTVRLVTWGVAAALVQWLPPSGLLLACAAALAAGAWYAQRRLGLLLKRTRNLAFPLLLYPSDLCIKLHLTSLKNACFTLSFFRLQT